MRRLKILWVLMETPVTNAPFRYLVGELGKRHDASLCTFFPVDGAGELRKGGTTLHEGNGTVGGFISAFRRSLRSSGVDVVSIHLPHLAVLAVPLLLFYRSWRWRRSSVYVVHNSFPTLRLRNKLLTVMALTFYRHIVICGAAAAASLPPLARRLAGLGVVVIPNGADISGVQGATGKSELVGDRFTVVTAARLEAVKRLEDSLRAFADAELDGARLLLIGDGSQRPDLESLAASVAPDRVSFTGMIPREEVYRAMRQSDCYLSTSSSEGMPVAILEAMAAGLPLVLSDIPPHREVADGLAGVRFAPVGDVDGFASALRDLASLSSEERSRLGDELRDHVAANFSLDAYLTGYEDLYLSLAR